MSGLGDDGRPIGVRTANPELIGPGTRDGLLLTWCIWVSGTAARCVGFSPGNSGDDAGESGETSVSGSGLLTSLAPYSGVGRR